MSRKDFIKSFNIISDGEMADTSVITSVASNIQTLDNVGIQLSWTSSPVGSFQIQISIDYDPITKTTGQWSAILLTYWDGAGFVTSYNLPTSLGSPYYLDLALISAPWIRVVYTNESDAGVLNAYLSAKAV